jgi:hypothetical protein
MSFVRLTGEIITAKKNHLLANQSHDSVKHQKYVRLMNLQVLRGGMPSELCAVATLAVARRAMAKMQRKVERCMLFDVFCGILNVKMIFVVKF